MKRAALLACIAALAAAQQMPPAKAVISGTVREAGTGAPIPGAHIVATLANKGSPADADSQGRYTIGSLDAGRLSLRATADTYLESTRAISLLPGQQLTSVDFELTAPATISGVVLDENKEPLPDIYVSLIGSEYYLGIARYVFANSGYSDDRGQYVIRNVPAGRAYLLLARKRVRNLEARSDVPLDPRRRRPTPAPTYYSNSPTVDGAMAFTLRPGEQRTGIDIQMHRAPAFCLEAVTLALGSPAPAQFEIDEQEPVQGGMNYGGYFGLQPTGKSPPDGKLRICDLHPGQYRILAYGISEAPAYAPQFFTDTPFVIADKDVKDFRVQGMPPLSLSGEVVWSTPDAPASDAKINVDVMPVTRPRWVGEGGGIDTTVPGPFTFQNLVLDNYAFRVRITSPGVYLKDVTYGGTSVLNQPLRPGTAPQGSGLRVILARDGGSITVQVADKDRNPIADANVYVLPSDAPSEAALSTRLVVGATDQNGMFRTPGSLAPGKYIALASSTRVTYSPEHIAALWRSRSRGTELDLAPSGAAQVKLQPVALDQDR